MKIRPIVVLASALLGLLLFASVAGAVPTNQNGVGTAAPAYYDGTLFKINFMLMPEMAQTALHAHNGQFNIVYQSDPGLPGGLPFVQVLDAIQRDGFNPVWEEWQITFTQGHTPRQLYSDTEVLAAAASGEITLTDTDEMYRCSAIGKP